MQAPNKYLFFKAGLLLCTSMASMAFAQTSKISGTDKSTHVDSPVIGKKETVAKQKLERISLKGPTVEAFQPFSNTAAVQVNEQSLIIESQGMPEHGMMVGIRAWQQQVPLPQHFTDDNAWQLPLKPEFAANPISVLKEPLRGAIALAVNGVPIFCALNNRGDDTYLAGELDKWGGHCGRGDDYHYHIAPLHLEKKVGRGNPIAFALDGYPILGLSDLDGTQPRDLDEFNGHQHDDGNYHYHATKDFPYVNGGLKGVVEMDRDQIRQPRGANYRPAQSPLRGATITGFHRDGNQFALEYEMEEGGKGKVEYVLWDDERVDFYYTSPNGNQSTQSYRRGRPGQSQITYVLILAIPLVIGAAVLLAVRNVSRKGAK